MNKKRNKKKNHHNINEQKKYNTSNINKDMAGQEDAKVENYLVENYLAETSLAENGLSELGASEMEKAQISAAEIDTTETAEAKTGAPEPEEIQIIKAEIRHTDIEEPEADENDAIAAESALDASADSFNIDESDRKDTDTKTEEVDIDIEITGDNVEAAKTLSEWAKYIAVSSLKVKTLSERAKHIAVSGLKVLVSVAVCVIVIAAIISLAMSKKADSSKEEDNAQSINEPLQENAYENVNEFIARYFKALSDGDTETITALTDYVDKTSLITYEKRSEFIEEYKNITCYTKPGLEENSYFLYAAYDAKVNDIDTVAPGLVPLYLYTAQDGSLKIDGDRDERVEAAFKLVTNQDDVVDLYNRIDVKYKEVVAADDALKTFMEELPGKVKTSVGEALAQIERQNDASAGETEPETAAQPPEEEQPQNQTLNQRVRATDTVNVRKSDSEEADRIGKVSPGTELTRVEEKVNGWSKVIYEGKEAYIKSNYLEVISTEAEGTPAGSVKAKTNVNVRGAASQDSQKLGVAQAGKSYELLENLGEWHKIKYNGMTGYVKAEFFE